MRLRYLLWGGAGVVGAAGVAGGAWTLSLPAAREFIPPPPIGVSETQALLVRQVHVNCSRVLPLVESVQFGSKPVAAANQCVGNRP